MAGLVYSRIFCELDLDGSSAGHDLVKKGGVSFIPVSGLE